MTGCKGSQRSRLNVGHTGESLRVRSRKCVKVRLKVDQGKEQQSLTGYEVNALDDGVG